MAASARTRDNWRAGLAVGLHYDFHARPDDGDIGRGLTVEELVELWQEVGPDWVQCDTKGYLGYTSYPTEVGARPDVLPGDHLRIYRDASRRLGLRLVSHYCSLINHVAAAAHPDWARVDQHDNRSTEYICVTSQHDSELMVPQLLELVDRYDIDGVWVDCDAWLAAPCYCDRCQQLFRTSSGLELVPRAEGQPGWEVWLEFHRACYERHVRTFADAVHREKPDFLVTVNWAYSLMQPETVALPVDTLSGDLAHVHTADWAECESRFLDGRGLPWDLQLWTFTHWGLAGDDEMRGVEHLCQGGAITLAAGGAPAYYVIPLRTGRPVRWQHEVLAEAVRFCRDRAPHSIGTESVPQVAVLHSVDSHYAASEPLAGSHEVGLYTSNDRTAAVKGAVLTLLDLHCHVDVITDDGLEQRARQYPVVVVPEPRRLSDATIASLEAYVEAGGRLLLSGTEVTELMPRLTGLAAGGALEPAVRWVDVGGRASGFPGPWRQAAARAAQMVRAQLATQDPQGDDTPFAALSVNRVGRGIVATVPANVFASLFGNRLQWRREVVRLALDALEPDLDVSLDAPPSVHLSYRRRGDTRVVHLVSLAADPPLSPRKMDVERVPATGPLTLRVRMPAEPSAVHVEPGVEFGYRWEEGRAVITVQRLHIHAAVVLES